ncbi:3-hydroxybutyryl-CoA dehydratase [uncultured Desulfobacterium sp.]|uniref:3-hydroxybutyryl-CoA dehydratase n=1 Tax=uncultured Desulfobacterium sp. TaxID=201089 RepID=A0A445MVU8_9BACT|nr:3-hydroxybutyryl-CoA dehydratase [uncultured Desulfobacterium sp.]
MEYENIIFEVKEGIAVLTVNRPKKMNALNFRTMDEIKDAIATVKGDDSIRAMIITGAGDKAFVAGADISEFTGLGLKESYDFIRRGAGIFRDLEALNVPTIAAVNGMALGGGCELAMGCTFRIASENALFGLPELGLGVIPGYGGTQRLPRIIGRSQALWAMLTGENLDANKALALGLANQVAKPEELMDVAMKLAKKIATKAPLAVKFAMIATKFGDEVDLETGLVLEALSANLALASDDKKEGVAAFLEKRKPTYQGK